MRHINRERVFGLIPKEWHQDAANALEKVRGLPPEERGKAIDGLSSVWRDLKFKLHEASYGKCWYCETRGVRDDDEVDHRRPKNEVEECTTHPGYWWLAFDWENFRYSCVYCNQRRNFNKSGKKDKGGKGTSFPLLNPDQRIFDECLKIDLFRERPVLLDPMVATDTLLLMFEVDGGVHPAKDQHRYPDDYKRACDSVITYHLDAQDLKEKRQRQVCNVVERLIQEGEGYHEVMSQKTSAIAEAAYAKVVDKLSLMIHEREEYSAAARSILRIYRTKYPWILDILDAA